MTGKEYRQLPDEFNLNYNSKRNGQEEKKKKRRIIRLLVVFVSVTLLLMPPTINQGLGSLGAETKEDPIVLQGTYQNGEVFVHFDEETGWFYDGQYFIPMTFNSETLEYRSAGAVPQSTASSLDSTVYYLRVSGKFSYQRDSVVIADPFSGMESEYQRTDQKFYTASIDAYNRSDFSLAGHWVGVNIPVFGFPCAYVSDAVVSERRISLLITDSEGSEMMNCIALYELKDGVMSIQLEEPLVYTIALADETKEFRYDENLEAIVFIRQNGIYIGMNVFSWQVLQK